MVKQVTKSDISEIECLTCNKPLLKYKRPGENSYIYRCQYCKKRINLHALKGLKCREKESLVLGRRGPRPENKSGFKGVSFDKSNGKYISKIQKDGKRYKLGYFTNAEDAAIAYNLKALELYGPTAFQNDITKRRNPKEYEYGTKGHNPYVECST